MDNRLSHTFIRTFRIIKLSALCFAVLVLSNCSAAKQAEQKAALSAQEANFNALNTAVMEGELKPGLSGQEIQARFGEPDDIYRLMSQVSVTEIWTYQQNSPKTNTSRWRPIRLTFENHKLLNISY